MFDFPPIIKSGIFCNDYFAAMGTLKRRKRNELISSVEIHTANEQAFSV